MTSRISFSKLTFDELRKLTWLTAIQFLGFGVLIPIRVLTVLASHATMVEKYEAIENFAQEFCNNAGLGMSENTMCILIAGIFCALCAFGYLHASVKLDFLHSLPIRRERLFAVKYLSATLTFVIAYVINQVFAVLIGTVYGAVNTRIVYEMGVATLQGILFFLCSFSGTLIAIMLTGKILTSVFAVIVLAAYVPILIILGKFLEAVFLPNILDSGSLAGMNWLLYTSPWAFCVAKETNGQISEEVLTGSMGVMPGIADLCQLVAVIAICTAVALGLYRIRKTEAAGSALAFGKTEGVIKLLLAIPGAIFAAVLAYELFENLVMTVVFLLLAAVIFCMIMEFIYRWDIQQILKKKSHIVITTAAALLVFFLFYFDVAGINSYLPAKDEIAAMAVRDTLHRYNFNYGDDLYEYGGIRASLAYLETEQIDKLYELAQSGIENGERETVFDEDTIYVYMKYRLKNGKEVYRNYWVDTELYLDAMDELIADEYYRDRYFGINTWTEEDVKQIEGNCWLPEEAVKSIMGDALAVREETAAEDTEITGDVVSSVSFTPSQLWRVVQAYQKDFADMSYQDFYYATGDLYFYNLETYETMGSYGVGEAFTETMKVLGEIWLENTGAGALG